MMIGSMRIVLDTPRRLRLGFFRVFRVSHSRIEFVGLTQQNGTVWRR
jgi:hypothetical protein